MRKFVLFALLFCMVASSVSAQEVYKSSGKTNYKKKKKTGYDPDKLVIGGGFDAAYSNGVAIAGLSPMVGYRFLKPVIAGIGLGYLYMQQPNGFSTYTKTYYNRYHIVYPNVWTRIIVFRNFYLTASYEHDFLFVRQGLDPSYNGQTLRKYKLEADCLLAGAGLRQPLGSGRSSFYVEIAHDFLNSEYSPYTFQPLIFRAGIAFGL